MKKNYEKNLKTKSGWTKIPNAIRHDEKLTSDAKVVIEELLSVSGDFQIYEAGIANALHLSLVRVKNAIKLLKSEGYIQLTKVKDGSHFGGWEWRISDTNGTFRTVENRTIGNRTVGNAINPNENSERSETELSETLPVGNLPIYQITERFQTTNHQEMNFQGQKKYEETKGEVAHSPFSPTNKGNGNIISSGDVNTIQAFNKFCEIFPRLGDREAAQAAFFQIPDISKICWQIVQSVEWFENLKRWDDWQTGQKNKYCPQAAKFLKREDWQEYMRTGATKSRREELDELLPDEEGEYETDQ